MIKHLPNANIFSDLTCGPLCGEAPTDSATREPFTRLSHASPRLIEQLAPSDSMQSYEVGQTKSILDIGSQGDPRCDA